MNPDQLFKNGKPETTNNQIITCSEKRSKYVASNPQRKLNSKIKIDNALIKGNDTLRCDYGLWVEEGNRMILIELKGCDVEKALKQLFNTHKVFQTWYKTEDFNYSFRVVPTRVTTPNLQEHVKKLRRQGCDLQIQTKVLKEVI